jgi:flagellar basal body rod protein FlgG
LFLNSALTAALDTIAERAADVRRAFTPGAFPQHDDVATPSPKSDFTLDPLAASAPDGAYFVVRDDRGEYRYTRAGDFEIRDGGLTDRTGMPVCGVRGPNGEVTTLRVDAVDAALGRASAARIEPDGTLSYRRDAIDPRNGARESQRIVAGRVLLAGFPGATRLESDGEHLRPPAGVEPQRGLPGEGQFGALQPMHRERSRIDVDQGLARLKEAYMRFEAIAAAENAKGHLGKTAMDLLK